RRVLDDAEASLDIPIDGVALQDALLAPTRIYVPAIRALQTRVDIHAMAHITGGRLAENLARVLPPGVTACIERASWQQPPVFDWLAASGDIAASEMLRTFNCGIGFVVVLPADQAEAATASLRESGEQVFEIGRVQAGDNAEADAVELF